MADTPSDGGADSAKPRRPRKPRSTTTRSASTGVVKPRAKSAKLTAPRAAAAAATAVKSAARKAPKRATGAATSPKVKSTAGKVAKAVQDGVNQAAPAGKRKGFALAAAVAGIAAGIAATFGRRKLVKVATDAIDAVGGDHAAKPPTRSAD